MKTAADYSPGDSVFVVANGEMARLVKLPPEPFAGGRWQQQDSTRVWTDPQVDRLIAATADGAAL